MKLLIGGVLALFCMQATVASLVGRQQSSCQQRFRTYKKAVSSEFDDFKNEHDIAHADYETIKAICETLLKSLANFTDPSFGQGLTPQEIECLIAKWFEAFFAFRIKALKAITHLLYKCDVLLNMADEFRCNNNVVCNKNSTLSGCEAETNDEKCALAAFYDALATFGAQAKAKLVDLLAQCNILGKVARDFYCQYKPKCRDGSSGCGCSGYSQSDPNLLAQFQAFLRDQFIPPHNDAHSDLVVVGNIRNLLTAAIKEWTQRY